MKTLITKSILLILGLSQFAFAQSSITEGVNFFRRSNTMVPINATIASAEGGQSLGFQTMDSAILKFIEVGNGGLTYTANIVIFDHKEIYRMHDRADQYKYSVTFTGEINLSSCIREDGKNIFGQFKSLEEVMRYSHESANSTQFSSCIFQGKVFSANYTTPNGSQPRPTMEDVKVAIFADHLELAGSIKGEEKGLIKLKFPFLYYNNQNDFSLQSARQKILGTLEGALAILQGEIGDKQLPKTVAYIMENRHTLQEALRELEGKKLGSLELIELSVSVKNAFHVLDQAVGLASDRQIQMRDLIQLK